MYLYRVCCTDSLSHYDYDSTDCQVPLYLHLLNYTFQDIHSSRTGLRSSDPLPGQITGCNTTYSKPVAPKGPRISANSKGGYTCNPAAQFAGFVAACATSEELRNER
jgi:hypothetical protein